MSPASGARWAGQAGNRPRLYVCERCGHYIVKRSPGYYLHWDEDDAWSACPCVDDDAECVPEEV